MYCEGSKCRGKKTSTIIAICHPSHFSLIEDVFMKAFDTRKTMFFADKVVKRKVNYSLCNNCQAYLYRSMNDGKTSMRVQKASSF